MAVVAKGRLSKLSREIEVTSEAVMEHMALRLTYADPGFRLSVYTDADLEVLSSAPCILHKTCAAESLYFSPGLTLCVSHCRFLARVNDALVYFTSNQLMQGRLSVQLTWVCRMMKPLQRSSESSSPVQTCFWWRACSMKQQLASLLKLHRQCPRLWRSTLPRSSKACCALEASLCKVQGAPKDILFRLETPDKDSAAL